MFIRSIVLGLFISMLLSCAYVPKTAHFQNRDKHYLTAKNAPAMRIPPGVNTDCGEGYYPVSSNDYPETAKKVNLQPPEL